MLLSHSGILAKAINTKILTKNHPDSPHSHHPDFPHSHHDSLRFHPDSQRSHHSLHSIPRFPILTFIDSPVTIYCQYKFLKIKILEMTKQLLSNF